MKFSLSLFAVLALSCAAPGLFAQSSFYMHLEGHIGEGIKMNADMVRIDDRFSGYYYYYFLDTLKQMDFGMRYGKALPVEGTIRPDNTVEFTEFSKNIKGAVFRGVLKDGAITGNWVSSDGKKTLPFVLTESYPEGTIAFTVYHLKDRGPLFAKKESPAASIDLTLLLPKPYGHSAAVDSLNKLIFNEFFIGDTSFSDPQLMLGYARDLYFENYRHANADIYQEGSAAFDWNKNKSVRIQYNENEYLSLEFHDYGHTGGAHGLSIAKFSVIGLEDGQRLTLEKIFREDYSNDLRDILTAQVRRQYEIASGTDLRDAGFFVEAVDPTENFYLNKDGMGFYYNQYEVASFATGPVDVFVPYRQLKRIMDPASPLYKAVMEVQ